MTTHPDLAAEWSPENAVSPDEVVASSSLRVEWICSRDRSHRWEAMVISRVRSYLSTGCPLCYAHRFSSGEGRGQEIAAYIRERVKSVGAEYTVLTGVRSLIAPQEVDIYIPEKNLAIEYNGVFWHSEQAGKHRMYHYEKYQRCREAGVLLFQVWEDDWLRNRGLVQRMIDHRLGISEERRVYARDTVCSAVGNEDAHAFLTLHHLQGAHHASSYYGLRDAEGALVSLMGIQSIRDDGGSVAAVEVSRFASSAVVVGGFSKLLKNVLRQDAYRGARHVVSYSHNDHSWGDVYEKSGFIREHEGAPGYFYVLPGTVDRVSRWRYPVERFRRDEDLLYEKERTEQQLSVLNGFHRVWDAGSAKWVLEC